ncbi:hypothetical protein NUSPORA_01820 [Nucleospora cyclopteri]
MNQGKPRTSRMNQEVWIPKTKLGRLVKNGSIKSIEEIFQNSLRIQEPEIVDFLLGKNNLKEEMLCIKSVQKQSKAGQKTSMKVVIVVGNQDGYIGLGTHSARELSTSIKAAINKAKMNIIPVRRGQWEGVGTNKHTVTVKASGKCGSVIVKLVPAPIGTGNAWSDIQRKVFELAGIQDIYVKSFGCTRTTENLAKATLRSLEKSSSMFIPSQWEEDEQIMNPLIQYSEALHNLENKATTK